MTDAKQLATMLAEAHVVHFGGGSLEYHTRAYEAAIHAILERETPDAR